MDAKDGDAYLLGESVQANQQRSNQMIPVKVSSQKYHDGVDYDEVRGSIDELRDDVLQFAEGVGLEVGEIHVKVVYDRNSDSVSIDVEADTVSVGAHRRNASVGDDISNLPAALMGELKDSKKRRS